MRISAGDFKLRGLEEGGRESESQFALDSIVGPAGKNAGSSPKRLVDCVDTDLIAKRANGDSLIRSNDLHSIPFGSRTERAIKDVSIDHYCFKSVRGVADGP